MEGLFLSSASYLLLAALALVMLAVVADWCRSKKKVAPDSKAPGPRPWPIIGSLHLLAGYDIPFKAFDILAKKFGSIFSIQLGKVKCLVVSDLSLVKEVLITKGEHFDGRPDFTRFRYLFDGNKQNSLAFCDWSEMQKMRRQTLKAHTFPRAFTSRFNQLDSYLRDEITSLTERFTTDVVDLKPLLLTACANTFFSHFCSMKFSEDDVDFVNFVRSFDEVFYEANQGCPTDFLPWLSPLYKKKFDHMSKWSHQIREFMMSRIMNKRLESRTPGMEQEDYIDSLIDQVTEEGSSMTLEVALFALEDIIGGHSAVANILMKIFGFVAQHPNVQKCVQDELDNICGDREVTLADRMYMPYTEAVVLECIRHVCSPIVPHVASQDTNIQGIEVEKGTLIFLNNYTLNMSPELWDRPEDFAPERFITKEGTLLKPEHFLPFGGGRRSCMGYKMTLYMAFFTLATFLQRFHISPSDDNIRIPLGNIALPYNTYKLRLHPR